MNHRFPLFEIIVLVCVCKGDVIYRIVGSAQNDKIDNRPFSIYYLQTEWRSLIYNNHSL